MEDSNVKGGVEGLFRDKIFAAVSPLPKGQNAKEEGRGGGEERRGEERVMQSGVVCQFLSLMSE